MLYQATNKINRNNSSKFFDRQAGLTILLFLTCLAPSLRAQETWEEMVDFDDAEITNIEFINRVTGFVGGGGSETESPAIFKTIDGGLYWTPVEHNIQGHMFAMGFLNDTIGFISTSAGLDSYIYRTTDQGLSWEKVYTMYLRTPAFSFIGDSTVFAMQTSTDYAMTTKSIDCGENWETLDTFTTEWGALGVTDFTFLTKDIGYMIYESGILYRTNDGGETFEEVYQDFQYDFLSLDFQNADTGYITGEVKYGRTKTNDGIILKTTDGGASWQSTPIPGECTDVVFVNSDTGYLATNAGPLHTYNAGADWQPDTMLPEGYLKSFSFPDANTGYAIGRKYYSDDIVYKNGVTFGTAINTPRDNYYVKLYPNPAKNVLQITLTKGIKIKKIIVYNMQSESLMQRKEAINSLDISNLQPGSYILEIQTNNTTLKEKFIVK